MPRLVLTRKQKEGILITHAGETLRLSIADIGGSRVRLCFEAAESFQISREDAVERPQIVNARREAVMFPEG